MSEAKDIQIRALEMKLAKSEAKVIEHEAFLDKLWSARSGSLTEMMNLIRQTSKGGKL